MEDLVVYILVGFLAQMIDGSLGMAYGVSSTTFLLNAGLSPTLASASVHMAEVCTTGVSGLSHMGLGNVDKTLFKRLILPGMLGGILGAYILTSVSGDAIKPFVAIYLLLMGVRILWKALKTSQEAPRNIRLIPLGLAGGFLDAIGGGGWGPVVTSTLVANGHEPRFAVGSVNTSEFFVTFAQSITFLIFLRDIQMNIVGGLLIGGVIAAPFAAYASKYLAPRKLMFLVGVVIILLSLRTLFL